MCRSIQKRSENHAAWIGPLVAISVDPPDRSLEIVEAYDLEFPILSDPDVRAIEAFGVLHPNGGLDGDIARPASFLLDRDGRVVWRDLTDNWRVRTQPDRILEQVRSLRRPA